MDFQAITFDEISDTGKVINSNVKMNRIITDENVLAAVSTLEQYGQIVIDE